MAVGGCLLVSVVAPTLEVQHLADQTRPTGSSRVQHNISGSLRVAATEHDRETIIICSNPLILHLLNIPELEGILHHLQDLLVRLGASLVRVHVHRQGLSHTDGVGHLDQGPGLIVRTRGSRALSAMHTCYTYELCCTDSRLGVVARFALSLVPSHHDDR